MTMPLPDDAVVHRVGGAAVDNLRLRPQELVLFPPGISILVGGTPADAAAVMRAAYPRNRRWHPPTVVGTATVADIRAAGFDTVVAPTPTFANHGRIVHPAGPAGFTDDELARLAAAFQNNPGN